MNKESKKETKEKMKEQRKAAEILTDTVPDKPVRDPVEVINDRMKKILEECKKALGDSVKVELVPADDLPRKKVSTKTKPRLRDHSR